VHVIRHKVLVEGLSSRQVARELGISRNTVSKYLKQPQPERREGPQRKPVLEQVAPRIDELLGEWSVRTTPKQRITGTRIHRQLREEGYEVGTTTVRAYLRERRRQAAEVYIPLVYRRGDVAQADSFEVTVDEQKVRRKAWKFLLRMMYSGRKCGGMRGHKPDSGPRPVSPIPESVDVHEARAVAAVGGEGFPPREVLAGRISTS